MPEDISLLPQEIAQVREQEVRERKVFTRSLVFLTVALLIGSGVFIYSFTFNQEINSVKNQVNQETNKSNTFSQVEKQIVDLTFRSQALTEVINKTSYFSRLLSTISAATPPDVQVMDLTAPNEETVTLSGSSRSYMSLAKFLMALKGDDKKEKFFSSVELRSVSLDKQSGEARFELALSIRKGALR